MDISVIVPIYNVERYLKKCIDSLINQNIDDYEILLINDGSTDSSLSICEEYQSKYPNRIKVIDKKNEGLSATRNEGIKRAIGKYLMFVDSDDWIETNCLENIKNICNKNVDIILGNYIVYNEEIKNDYFKKESKISNDEMNKYEEWCKYIFDKKICDIAWRIIVRRELVIENSLFFAEGLYHEDNEWVPKIICNANTAQIYDIPFYYYRRRSNSITSKKTIKNHMDMLEICKLLKEFNMTLKIGNKKTYITNCVNSCLYTTLKLSCNMTKKDKILIKNKIYENNLLEYLYINSKLKILCKSFGIYNGILIYDTLIKVKQYILKKS